MTDPTAPTTPEAIYAEHRKCGPKYEGCYSHFTFMDHCRADGMAWPCDVAQLAASRATPAEALDCGICGKHVMEAVCLDCYERNLDGG